ncbi:hypothetical protein [Kitasatospora cineracea]|uniref:hypothetical protein n=1 Tax=Kitasatospora cineracea TaxID=88074 RepID=UPI003402FFAC
MIMHRFLDSPLTEEATVKAFGVAVGIVLELLLQVVAQRQRKSLPEKLPTGRRHAVSRRRRRATSRPSSRRGRAAELLRVKRRFRAPAGPGRRS